MPVKGLTDRNTMPRVGKIHLGERVHGEERKYPKATPHFVVRQDDTTPGDASAAFKEIYGDEPTELDVMFVSDDPAHLPDAWRKAYSQSRGLICKGDGETASAKWDLAMNGERPFGTDAGTWAGANTKEVTRQTIRCMGDECPMTRAKRCKSVMNLQFVLPTVRGIGVWQIDTGSWFGITNVLANVQMIQAAVGSIRGVLLKLRLVAKEVTPKNATKKTVHVLELSLPDVSLMELNEARARLPDNRLLPPVVDDEEPPADMPDIVPHLDEATGEVPMTAEQTAEAETRAAELVPDVEGADAQVPDGTPEFLTLGDLFNMLYDSHGINRARALQLLGYDDVSALEGLDKQHVYLKVCRKANITPKGGSSDAPAQGSDEAAGEQAGEGSPRPG